MIKKIIFVLLLLTAAGLQEALAAPSVVVEIRNIAFNPANITISKGTTVIWMQNESINLNHTVTSDTGVFDSGTLILRQTFNWTFNETGTFKYHCTIHPTIMLGTVIVTEAPKDILTYYRGLGNDPNVIETTDLLKAADDWSNSIAPPGFISPITTQQLLALADEWSRS
jgi:plastocyanin